MTNKTATEMAEEQNKPKRRKNALNAEVHNFIQSWSPHVASVSRFTADLISLVQAIHQDAIVTIAESQVIMPLIERLAPTLVRDQEPKGPNVDTVSYVMLKQFLGSQAMQWYITQLQAEINIPTDEIATARYYISRATNFDKGAMNDCGCWNVVIYSKSTGTSGYCVVVRDYVPPERYVLTRTGGHDWRNCPCYSCYNYRKTSERKS